MNMADSELNLKPNCTIKIKKILQNVPTLQEVVICGFVNIKLSGVSDEQICKIVAIAEEMCK